MAKKPRAVYRDNDESAERMEYSSGGESLSLTQQAQYYPESSRSSVISQDAKYEELLHSVYDAVLITDFDGNITEVNIRAEHCFMWDMEQLKKMNVVDLIAGANDDLLSLLRRNINSMKYTILEAMCVRGDEGRFFAEIVVNRLRGRPRELLCFFVRDISVRKKAEAELQEANGKLVQAEKIKARMDTLSTLYYALNNPLQILMSLAEIDQNQEYRRQLGRVVEVLEQLRKEESLDVIVDGEGASRYDISITQDLKPCDTTRLLVVDDENLLRNIFVDALKQAFPSLTIESASDGRQARDAFDAHHHAVILMDVAMPVMDGEQAFNAIKSICETEGWKIPEIVFCTGFTMPENLRRLVEGDSCSCVTKPVAIRVLVETVRQHLERLAEPEPQA